MTISATVRLSAGLSLAASFAIAGSSALLAEAVPDTTGITIRTATIAAGRLVVTGTAPTASAIVKLDNLYSARSNAQRAFSFSLAAYHPADCVIVLTAGKATATAVVANCGERGVNPRGGWLGTDHYLLDDLVVFQGSSWRAKLANTNKPPSTNPSQWEKFAAKGDAGATGARGAAGPQGPTGAQGPVGPQGLDTIVSLDTNGHDWKRTSAFSFVGSPVSIQLSSSQRVTASAVLFVYNTNSSLASIDDALCYEKVNAKNPVVTRFSTNFQAETLGGSMSDSLATSASVVPGASGTYKVGLCAATNYDNLQLDSIAGWAAITN